MLLYIGEYKTSEVNLFRERRLVVSLPAKPIAQSAVLRKNMHGLLAGVCPVPLPQEPDMFSQVRVLHETRPSGERQSREVFPLDWWKNHAQRLCASLRPWRPFFGWHDSNICAGAQGGDGEAPESPIDEVRDRTPHQRHQRRQSNREFATSQQGARCWRSSSMPYLWLQRHRASGVLTRVCVR